MNVQIPNARVLLHVLAAELREFLQPVAVVEAEQGEPKLVVADDLRAGLRAKHRVTPGPHRGLEEAAQLVALPHLPASVASTLLWKFEVVRGIVSRGVPVALGVGEEAA